MALSKPPPNSPLRWDHPLAQGLVGAWPMWEGAGGYVYDATGRGNNGTLTSMDPATDWVGTPYGMGLDFDGGNDYISYAGMVGPVPTGLTLTVVAKPASLTADRYVTGGAIGDDTGQFNDCCLLCGYQDNNWNLFHCGSYPTATASQTQMAATLGWQAVTYSFSSAWVTGAVDGAILVDRAVTSTYVMRLPTLRWRIGTTGQASPTIYWAGKVAMAALHGRRMLPAEIAELHSDLFALWRPPKRWWYASAGATIHYISGSLAIGSAGSAGGVVVAPVAGSLPISAAGQAQGNVVAPIAGALPIGASGSAGGAVVAPVGGAFSIGSAGAAGGVVVAPVGGSLPIGAAGSAGGAVVAPVTGSLPIGAGGAAVGNVVAPVAATMNIGAAGQAEGVVVAPIAGELEIGAEGTAAGTVVTEGGARGWLAPVLESGRYES